MPQPQKAKTEKSPELENVEPRQEPRILKLGSGRLCETEKIFDHLEIGRAIKVVNRPANPYRSR